MFMISYFEFLVAPWNILLVVYCVPKNKRNAAVRNIVIAGDIGAIET